eukprot:6197803-Pleurochrysis_carterae.AAC.3
MRLLVSPLALVRCCRASRQAFPNETIAFAGAHTDEHTHADTRAYAHAHAYAHARAPASRSPTQLLPKGAHAGARADARVRRGRAHEEIEVRGLDELFKRELERRVPPRVAAQLAPKAQNRWSCAAALALGVQTALGGSGANGTARVLSVVAPLACCLLAFEAGSTSGDTDVLCIFGVGRRKAAG